MSKVAIVKCNSYDQPLVNAAVARGLELIGGLDRFVSEGEKVLLKPNLVAADPPERCATTHPAVMEAIALLLKERDMTVTYGDSPGFHAPLTAAKKSGLDQVAVKYGIELADFEGDEEIFFQEALQNKKLRIAKGILEADAVISLPKLKTHGFQKMTGAIKNQFGCVPGPLKGEMHVKLPNADDFAKMLVDINSFVKPRLYIMDGIMAMEGNGPRGGSPFPMNVLLISDDPVALDATICRLVDLDPAFVPTTRMGQEAGLGTYEASSIELVGDGIEDIVRPKFDVDRHPLRPYKSGWKSALANRLVVPKPYIKEDKCVKCGVCVLMCTVEGKAVNWKHGDKKQAPVYHYNKCIRCYCCQEMCPESAIELNVPPLRRMMDKKYR